MLLKQRDLHGDLAALGEFDCITHKVRQYLPEADGVAGNKSRNTRVDFAGQFQILFRGTLGEDLGDAFDGFMQIEVGAFQLELARLDLRKIEHVVDQIEQRQGRDLRQIVQ